VDARAADLDPLQRLPHLGIVGVGSAKVRRLPAYCLSHRSGDYNGGDRPRLGDPA
jgi:hypothetical protein